MNTPTICVDEYYNPSLGESVLTNATVRCPHCNHSNRPLRKKQKPVRKTPLQSDGTDLSSRHETSCSACRKAFVFRFLYPQ